MKEKGLLTEDAEGNIDFGSSDEPKIAAPPRISIIHSRSEQTLDNLMTFEMSDSGVTRVIFTITGFELNKLYPGKFIHQDGEDIVEQIEPSVSHEGKVSSTSSASYK